MSDVRKDSKIHKFNLHGNVLARGISFDSQGNVYVADTTNSHIQKSYGENPDGKFLMTRDKTGLGPENFIMPQDIAIDSNDNIYVSDIGTGHPEISYVRSFMDFNIADRSCTLKIGDS